MDVLHAPPSAPHPLGPFERRAAIAPRCRAGGASFPARLALAPVVGSEFVPPTDQGFTQLAIRMTVGLEPRARSDEKVRQVEAIVAAFPRCRPSPPTWGQGTGCRSAATRRCSTSGWSTEPRARSQKQVEDAIRAEIARIAGIEVSVGFDRPIYVAVPRQRLAGAGARGQTDLPRR